MSTLGDQAIKPAKNTEALARSVSVVIPCFNSAVYIGSSIRSVLSQTSPPAEILVVDDCSTDHTCKVVTAIANHAPSVRLISLPKNSGSPAGPRNKGVQEARGEWIAFLDADDLWHPQKLELQMSLLGRSGFLMCSTAMLDFADESKVEFPPVPPSLQRTLATTQIHFRSQLVKYMTPTSSIVMRRDVALSHPFPEARKYRGREDFYCMLRVHEAIESSIKLLHPLVLYRQHDVQISRNKFEMANKQLMILREYRRRDGSRLGSAVYTYLLGHVLLSLYYRVARSRL